MSLITSWLESLSYDLEISDACLKKISPFSTCTSCLRSCPDKAIFLENGQIRIDEKSCSACGVCITACPVQAIKGQSPGREVIQRNLLIKENETLPSIIELLYFHKKGIRTIYHASSNPELEQRVNYANDYLEAMGLQPLDITNKLEVQYEQQPKVTRRDFFTKITSDSKKTVLSSVTPAKWRFNENNFILTSLYTEWSFYEVRINEESCTVCEACFNLCPSNVFDLDGQNLVINEQKCTGCRLCNDICRNDAIKIEPNVHQGPAETRPLHQYVCSKCGSSFHSWNVSHLCHICSSTEKPNFFL